MKFGHLIIWKYKKNKFFFRHCFEPKKQKENKVTTRTRGNMEIMKIYSKGDTLVYYKLGRFRSTFGMIWASLLKILQTRTNPIFFPSFVSFPPVSFCPINKYTKFVTIFFSRREERKNKWSVWRKRFHKEYDTNHIQQKAAYGRVSDNNTKYAKF